MLGGWRVYRHEADRQRGEGRDPYLYTASWTQPQNVFPRDTRLPSVSESLREWGPMALPMAQRGHENAKSPTLIGAHLLLVDVSTLLHRD